MHFREATTADIPQIQLVRNAVREHVLSDPTLVTDADCEEFITRRGKGWICEIGNAVVGFSVADLHDNNIWALFVDPAYEGRGIGYKLHQLMLDWYFAQNKEHVWLSTEPGTRAEAFYRKAGWRKVGTHGRNEVKFMMTYPEWVMHKRGGGSFIYI